MFRAFYKLYRENVWKTGERTRYNRSIVAGLAAKWPAPCDKEAVEQPLRVARGITLARKVLIIRRRRDERRGRCGGVSRAVEFPLPNSRYRGFAAATAAARATSNEVSRALVCS